MRRRRQESAFFFFSPAVSDVSVNCSGYHTRSTSRLWNDLLIPGMCVCACVPACVRVCVCALGRHREREVMPLSAGISRKPFHVWTWHWTGPCGITPIAEAAEGEEKRGGKAEAGKTAGARLLKEKWSGKESAGTRGGTPSPRPHTAPWYHSVDKKIYWMFCRNDGKLDHGEKREGRESERRVDEGEDWVLSPCMKPN